MEAPLQITMHNVPRSDALEARIRRLLVTTEKGDPAGILSIDDIVDGLARELASAVALMKAEIRRERADFGGG